MKRWIRHKGFWVKADHRTLAEEKDVLKGDMAANWLAKNDPSMKAKIRHVTKRLNKGKNNLKQNDCNH